MQEFHKFSIPSMHIVQCGQQGGKSVGFCDKMIGKRRSIYSQLPFNEGDTLVEIWRRRLRGGGETLERCFTRQDSVDQQVGDNTLSGRSSSSLARIIDAYKKRNRTLKQLEFLQIFIVKPHVPQQFGFQPLRRCNVRGMKLKVRPSSRMQRDQSRVDETSEAEHRILWYIELSTVCRVAQSYICEAGVAVRGR